MERYNTYDASLIDDPSHWQTEGSFFGLAQEPDAPIPWYESITKALTPIATSALNIYQQAQMQKMNRDRIAAGQIPLSPQEYAAAAPPTATVQAGLTPDTQRLLMYGAIGVGGFVLLNMLMRKR